MYRVMLITRNREYKRHAKLTLKSVAPACSFGLPTSEETIYTRFSIASIAALRQGKPLQEPFGNPRPQAFFFPRSASSAR